MGHLENKNLVFFGLDWLEIRSQPTQLKMEKNHYTISLPKDVVIEKRKFNKIVKELNKNYNLEADLSDEHILDKGNLKYILYGKLGIRASFICKTGDNPNFKYINHITFYSLNDDSDFYIKLIKSYLTGLSQ